MYPPRKGSSSNHSAATIYHRKSSETKVTTPDLHLLELENCPLDKTILQNLLNHPPNKVVNYKPRLNLKVDVEAIKEERERYKKENLRLEKQLMMMRLQVNTHKTEIKRLKEFEAYFQANIQQQQQTPSLPPQAPSTMTPQSQPQQPPPPVTPPPPTQPRTESLTITLQRKQMMQLKTLLVDKDNEILKLRKLPSSSLLMQFELQRQHLIEQTIRLKAYIVSRVDEPTNQEMVAEVARLLKEENQKLKGALRISEHEKMMAKAKKSSVKRLNLQLERELAELQERMKAKEAEVEMLTHQNKNLMFKKVNQLKVIQESKDREEIQKLMGEIGQIENAKKILEAQNKDLKQQLHLLKEKHKIVIQSQSQMQDKHQELIRHYKEKLEFAQEQLKSFKENYLKMPAIDSRKSIWNKVNKQSINIVQDSTRKIKPIRINQIRAQILYLKVIHRRFKLKLTQLLKKNTYKMGQLQELFTEHPFCLPSGNALKLARYLIEDSTRQGSLDMDKSEQKAVLLSILKTCLPNCQPDNPRDEAEIMQNWEKTIRIYSDRLIKKLGDMAKRGSTIIMEDIEHVLSELCIKKSVREMAYLQTKIYGDVFDQDAQFSLDKLSQFVESCLPDSHNIP